MIRKSSGGYTVYARSGRKMGTYDTKAEANARKAQLEMFKAMRAPAFSPGHRAQSSPTRERVIYWVASYGYGGKERVPMYFKGRLTRDTDEGSRGDVKARPVKLGPGPYVAVYGSDAFEDEAGHPLFGQHSWPGQPRRHARAAKLGHRRAQRSPVRGPAIKNALAYVHFHEKKQGRAQAARDAIQGQGLSYDEAQILLNALHVSRNEIERANVSRRAQRSPVRGLSSAWKGLWESRASGARAFVRHVTQGQVFLQTVPGGGFGNMPSAEFRRLYRKVSH